MCFTSKAGRLKSICFKSVASGWEPQKSVCFTSILRCHNEQLTVGFVRSGLFGTHAFSHAIEPTVGFVSMSLQVDCSESMHFDVQANQLQGL